METSTNKKLKCLEGLIDTTDISEKTNQFLKKVVPIGLAALKRGQPTNFSEAQTQYLEDVYNRHFS